MRLSPELQAELSVLIAMLQSMPIEQLVGYAVAAVPLLWAAMFAVKIIVTGLLRTLGLSHPAQYRFWLRLPWRALSKVLVALHFWHEITFVFGKRASGGFTSLPALLSMVYRPGQVLLGRAFGLGLPFVQPVGMAAERHMFALAMTGAGKTTFLITLLSTWRGSGFVLDPKGQISEALMHCDKRSWWVFDVYGISSAESIEINVFDIIKWAMAHYGEDAAVLWAVRISEALIVTPEGSKQPFFTSAVRGFIAGLILHVLTRHDESENHLPFVRDLLVGGYRVYNDDGSEESSAEEAMEFLYRMMRKNHAFGGAIAGAVSALMQASGEASGNVLATGLEQTKWLDLPAVRNKLKRSSVDLSLLKTRSDIVFSFVAPVLSIREELASLARLVTNMTSYVFEAEKLKNGQCLFLIDEFPSLGHCAIYEVLLPVARDYGISFCGVAQDVELLKKVYPKSWEGFLGNADIVWWMATNHNETAEYLSRTIGKKSVIEKDKLTGRKNHRDVEVISADQAKRFLAPGSGRMIVTRAGKRPLKLVNEPYFKALPVWKYINNPHHREPILRALMRFLFGKRAVKNRLRKSSPETSTTASQNPALTPSTNSEDYSHEHEQIVPSGKNNTEPKHAGNTSDKAQRTPELRLVSSERAANDDENL